MNKRWVLIISISLGIIILIALFGIFTGRVGKFQAPENYEVVNAKVECRVTQDCPIGMLCSRGKNIAYNKCVSQSLGDICGDGTCSNMEFKQNTCPEDCGQI